jgi:Tfp pilus assembly protein PilN
MINLLPSDKKEKLLFKKKIKLNLILLVLFFYFIFCLILVFYSIKIYSQIILESQEFVVTEKEKELDKSEFRNFKEEIKRANLELEEINSFYGRQIYISEILEKISQTLPPEIYLTDFSAEHYSELVIDPTQKELQKTIEAYGIKFSLTGIALNREILIWFKQELEKEESFEEIYFPLKNLVSRDDIKFSLTFKVKR